MQIAATLLALVATVTLVAAVAGRYNRSAPLVLAVVGVAASYLPFVPQIKLSSELVLVGFLPPLLYAASIRSSLVDFKANRRAIGLLSVGLVVFTAFAVALVTWWLLPVGFATALALGAVVSPPDAVSATAIGRRIGLPRRVVTVLEGESLLNDATALVLLRTAVMAATGTAAVTFAGVAVDFLRAAVGGVVIGLTATAVIGYVRRYVTNSVTDTSLSFMAPYIAYLPAEALHASGVLSVVVAGLLLGHKAPVLQNASSRLAERINWSTVLFLLENAVFLLIGTQLRPILGDVRSSGLPVSRIVLACVAVLLTAIVVRPLWVFPARYLIVKPAPDRSGRPSPWTSSAIVSWAGMRGVVTLAAAFALPPSRHREVLILAAMVVVGGTLLIQGLSLPWLARRLGVRGPDPREDALQEATVLQTAVQAGIAELDRLAGDTHPDVVDSARARAESRTNMTWERLGNPDAAEETPSDAYRRLRLAMLNAERKTLLEIRDSGRAEHEVLEQVMAALDLEEAMLERFERRTRELEDEPLLSPDRSTGECDHLERADHHIQPKTPAGCPDCEQEGTRPVHLRLCLTCGNVGCCDSSEGRHAERHYKDTDHAVMRSFEPGEAWRWCYVDELVG